MRGMGWLIWGFGRSISQLYQKQSCQIEVQKNCTFLRRFDVFCCHDFRLQATAEVVHQLSATSRDTGVRYSDATESNSTSSFMLTHSRFFRQVVCSSCGKLCSSSNATQSSSSFACKPSCALARSLAGDSQDASLSSLPLANSASDHPLPNAHPLKHVVDVYPRPPISPPPLAERTLYRLRTQYTPSLQALAAQPSP
jgi:hypothetical protein